MEQRLIVACYWSVTRCITPEMLADPEDTIIACDYQVLTHRIYKQPHSHGSFLLRQAIQSHSIHPAGLTPATYIYIYYTHIRRFKISYYTFLQSKGLAGHLNVDHT